MSVANYSFCLHSHDPLMVENDPNTIQTPTLFFSPVNKHEIEEAKKNLDQVLAKVSINTLNLTVLESFEVGRACSFEGIDFPYEIPVSSRSNIHATISARSVRNYLFHMFRQVCKGRMAEETERVTRQADQTK